MSELPSLPPLELRAPVTAPPTKRIASDGDMLTWQGSEAHDLILHFIARLAAACVQAPTRAVVWARDAHDGPDMIERVLALLIELDAWTDEIEPLQGPQRFGNLAFRTWGARLTERVEALHRKLLPTELHAAIPELTPYLLDAFGSFIRIDYGTGHELHWIAWLCVLCRLGVWGQPASRDAEARLALEVVPAYLRVVWHLQDRYALEPAGSHGVWGLDDYQFLPYILGASQLLGTWRGSHRHGHDAPGHGRYRALSVHPRHASPRPATLAGRHADVRHAPGVCPAAQPVHVVSCTYSRFEAGTICRALSYFVRYRAARRDVAQGICRHAEDVRCGVPAQAPGRPAFSVRDTGVRLAGAGHSERRGAPHRATDRRAKTGSRQPGPHAEAAAQHHVPAT